jgi:hypothetical protein
MGPLRRGEKRLSPDVLACIAAIPQNRLPELLPWNWQPHTAKAVRLPEQQWLRPTPHGYCGHPETKA